MTRRNASAVFGKHLVLDQLPGKVLLTSGDTFLWDRHALRTIAKSCRKTYLLKKDEVDPEDIFRHLSVGLVVGIHDKDVVPTHDWPADLTRFGLDLKDKGNFYDHVAIGNSYLDQSQNETEVLTHEASVEDALSNYGIWSLDLAAGNSRDNNVPHWIRDRWYTAQESRGFTRNKLELRTKGAWSGIKISGGGFVTGIRLLHGRQLVFFSNLDIQLESKLLHRQKESLKNWKYANMEPWEYIDIGPEDFIIIPPGKPFGTYVLDNSIASVHFWMQIDTLCWTEIGLYLQTPDVVDQARPEGEQLLRDLAESFVDSSKGMVYARQLQSLQRCLSLAQPFENEVELEASGPIFLDDSDASEPEEEPESNILYLFSPVSRLPRVENNDSLRILAHNNPVADLGGPFFGDAYASSTAAVSSSGLKQPLPSPDHNEPQDRPKPGNAQTVNAAASDKPMLPSSSKIILSYSPPVLSYSPPGQNSLTISAEDLDHLQPGRWLNDVLVNFGMICWLKGMQPEVVVDVYLFSSFFFTKLRAGGPQSVCNWTRSIQLFEKKYIIIPIHERDHWYLAVIYQPQPDNATPVYPPRHSRNKAAGLSPAKILRTHILILDSLGHDHPDVIEMLTDYLKQEASARELTFDWEVTGWLVKVPIQPNFYDCGIHLLYNVEIFMKQLIAKNSLIFPSEEEYWDLERISDRRWQLKDTIERLSQEWKEQR